jgi:hypothetical protein
MDQNAHRLIAFTIAGMPALAGSVSFGRALLGGPVQAADSWFCIMHDLGEGLCRERVPKVQQTCLYRCPCILARR